MNSYNENWKKWEGWQKFQKYNVEDNKFNSDTPEEPFPGYIENNEYPFYRLVHTSLDFKWCGYDSEDLYKHNLKAVPTDWHYKTKEVVYNVNRDGYRTYEWQDIDWKNSVVLLGCSCTFGVGLAEDETISYFLEKEINRPVINLGIPAGSNQSMLNNSVSILKYFEAPYGIVFNWTGEDRTNYYTDFDIINIGPWSVNTKDKLYKKLFENTIAHKSNNITAAYWIAQTARYLWQDKSRFISMSYFKNAAHCTRSDYYISTDRNARDLLHPGVEISKKTANIIKKHFK